MMIVGVLLYLSCVILSFASSVVSPFERNFSQYQPENHQVVESISDQFIKRNYRSSERLLVSKTEKDWLEAFIVKLQHLASTLQRNATSVKESNYLPVAQSFSSPTLLIPRKEEHSIEITSKTPEDDELVRELESLHKAPKNPNKPSITKEIAKKKETLVDEVVELRSLGQNAEIKLDGQLVDKFERLRDNELMKSENVPKVSYWNVSTSLVSARMDSTLIGMPRVTRKYFRWHKDPGFNDGALTNTIQKLHQNDLIRNEEGRAHLLKSFYMPYPLSQQKNESEFSEEMKRQLRDGRVLILSDSVVRSNFTS